MIPSTPTRLTACITRQGRAGSGQWWQARQGRVSVGFPGKSQQAPQFWAGDTKMQHITV